MHSTVPRFCLERRAKPALAPGQLEAGFRFVIDDIAMACGGERIELCKRSGVDVARRIHAGEPTFRKTNCRTNKQILENLSWVSKASNHLFGIGQSIYGNERKI